MKKILKFSRKRRGLSPNSSDAGSVLSVGYEIKEKDLGKVHKAASVGDLAKVKQLAKKNDLNQLDKENRTPLHIACAYGHVEVVLFLVESKVKLNLCDNQNRSPLMKAVQCQQETCAQILLEHSADPNLVDINGNTALHQAALIPSVPLGTQLLEHGANIDARNKDGCTPLILAVTENHTEVVEFLLKEGADVNAKDQGKRTSLIIAACNGQISLIRLLLAYDADITIKDEKGWTSDDYAVINGHHACSHLIIEHGTRKKSQQSPSFMVQSKEKQVRGSQVEDAAAGFSLGRPATDREVDDSSQAESISRASKCGGDSWPSSDEDDGLELSPKKPRKLNLTKLINTSGKGRKNATADLENSWSEHESDPEHEDTAKSDPGLRETLPTSRTFLPSDSIHSAPPQKTSRGTAKAHAGDGDCSDVDHEEEEDEDSNEEEDGQNDEPAQKRDFLSELGLGGGADEDEGSWDSSVSDKPSKAHIDSVSGHPVTGKPEKTLLPEKAEEAGPGDNLQRKPAVLQSTPSPSPAAAAAMNSPNRKIDLMEELGLGDVDDIEDPSEWDSTTSSSKSHDVFKKESQLEPLASGMEPSLSSSLPIAPAGPSEEPAPSTIGGRTRTPQRVVCPSQQPGPCKPPVTTEHQKDTSLNKNMDRADPEEPEKVCKEKRMLSGTQNQCPLWDAERPTGRSVIPGDILEQEPGERSHKTSPETGKRGKEPDSLSQGGGLNDAKGTGMALEQEGAGSDKDTSPSKHQQATRGIGAVQSVFEDSSLSEVSEDEERCAVAGSVKNEVFGPLRVAEEMDIVDDLTQSSDTGTDEAEFPTSGFRNASLQIRQLDSACIDSVSMVKLQNIFHEYERTIQRERGRCARLSDKLSHLEEERADLKKVLEETRDAKSVLEHRQVELDTDLKNLMFTLKQEQEKHRNASMLYGKSCEQLRIKEEQYHAEVQERQKVELAKRNLELEMRALISSMKQLEDDHSETRRSLAHERNSRSIQEGILSTHLHKQKELEEENVRNFAKCNEAVSQLSEASEREKELVKQNQKVEEELSLLRLELDRVRSQGRQEEVCLTGENETLRERLEDARRDLKLSGEALAQTVYQFNSQISALKAECSMSAAKTEHERQAREKLEAEAESARVRLVAALQEVERSQAARADAERSLRREREDWQRALEKSSAELASQRESVLSLSQQLGTAEAKANSLENECHRATLSLTEKSLLVETLQRERDQAQARLGELEAALQAEREQASRAAARQEATRERLAQVQSEAMLLHQQVEESQNRGVTKERALLEAQERFGELLAQLRADSEERVRLVEERSKELVSKNAELREQLLGQELEKTEREAALRQLQQELADTLKKLSMCEASLEVNSRYRNDLEEEKMRIHKDMDRLRGRLQESEDQYVQAERRVRDLKSVLDDKQSEVITSSQRLQEALAAAVKTDKMVKQLEGAVQRLEIENARLEASAKQQGHKIEVLQKEAAENAETSDSSPGSAARSRLEDLVANLQGSKMTLEDKLIREVQKQSVLSHNAQDTHQLWENELKTRARLSLRLAELEREKGELSGQVEIEKKKVKKTTEAKKSTDIRLDQEMQRNGELQKEISRLKTLLKTAKRKLKEQQDVTAGSLLSKPEDRSSPVKSRVEEFTLHLEREKTKCSELEALNLELKEQLASLNALSRTNERLQRSKKQLEAEVASLRQQMETRMVEHSLVEQYRRKADERARQEVQQKLEEVNLFLQTQAASQEALEQLKAASEGSVRTQLEQRVRELEGELSQARGAQQDSLSQKESVLTELQRYRELYVEELELRKSLAAKLERSNERLAEVNAKLLDDRQRSRSLMASSISGPLLDVGLLSSVGPYGASLGGGNGPSTKVETFLAKMQNELEKNISRELEKASAELGSQSARMSPIGSVAASQRSLSVDQDPVARATQQYLDVLKKNYRI